MVGSDGIEISARVSFDAVAAAYDTFMGRCTRLYLPALLAAANLVPGQRVLDVATGTGESAAMAVAPMPRPFSVPQPTETRARAVLSIGRWNISRPRS